LVEFSKSGSGDSVFEIPPGVIAGQVTGKVSNGTPSNLVIRFNDDIEMNEIIDNSEFAIDEYSGNLRLQPSNSKTIVEITNSTGVVWSFNPTATD
jgi:subtilase family serine protease